MARRALRPAAAAAAGLAFVAGARAEPLPRPAPIVQRPVVAIDACSAAAIKSAMTAAAAAAPADRAAASLSAFRTRVDSCVTARLAWAKTSTTGPTSWYRARTAIGDFLFQLWKGGVLMGTKPAEAYFVKCDATTMTQTDVLGGVLACVYGGAPVKPAEFEIFRARIQTTGPGP